MRLVERDYPLRVLTDRASRAADGEGHVVVVAGEAGIGKTVLLREFARRSPLPAAVGLCDPLSTPRPLGPLRDVAATLGADVVAALAAGAQQHELFALVQDALRGPARVLVVEDLHWADEASLDLVRFLARRVAGLPLLLVVSCRDGLGPAHPLTPVLGQLVSSPDVQRLRLAPLSRTAVADLVEGRDLDAADVHDRTAGNPFFVSQILAQPDAPLPDSVRDAVVARTAGLEPGARRALELMSSAPEGLSAALLAALAVPAATVEVLAATGLVDRRGDGIAFRHEIARTAVLDAVAPGTAGALHTRMIEALEQVGAEASVLTHHADAAGDVPRILRHAPLAAAEAARSGAHREAAAFYRRALRHVEDDPPLKAALLERLATELYLTDRLDEAIAARTSALDLRTALADVVAVGENHRAISLFAWYAADRWTAQRQDEAAVSILTEAGEPRALGYALANRAYLAAGRGDVDTGVPAGRAAQRIADEIGDPELHTAATINLALIRLGNGEPHARHDLVRARDTGLRLQVDELVTVPMSNLAHHDVENGRFVEADAILGDALRFSEERDIPICHMWQRGTLARLRLLQGRWAEAEREALAVLEAGDIPLGRLWAHLVLGLLAARRAAPAENPHGDELWRLAQRLDLPGVLVTAASALAEQAWISRRPDPRLAGPALDALVALPGAGGDGLRRWARRLAVAGMPLPGTWAAPAAADPAAGQPYEQALALCDEGTSEALVAALPPLDELGARAVATLVRDVLRERGVSGIPRGVTAATRANPAGLTERQLDVLALLVEGLSNADIAARLVISPRTADHHVSAILAKLGARSRGEAVAAARRLGVGG